MQQSVKARFKTVLHRTYRKFSHQSLFTKFLSVFVAMVLICFLLLGVTLGVFLSNYWSSQKEQLLSSKRKKHSEHYLICSLIKNSNRCLRLDSDDMQ